MRPQEADIVIVGAGPVGLMCAHLAKICGLSIVILDKSEEPLRVGRADALNARTLQLLEIAGLFNDLYPLGKPCKTSSVWADGRFKSRQSSWWDDLEGCLHKHFLMIGQAFVERLLDSKLKDVGTQVRRRSTVVNVKLCEDGCLTLLDNGESIRSEYVIGADGSRSIVRELMRIPFAITRPQIVWAVLDGILETDFPKVPEIIVFQNESSDVAWIPREGNLDRFYVRMDAKTFTPEEAIAKIERAVWPHKLRFQEIVWSSQFSVKESVAESFAVNDRIFLAGDACHIHSVNGGQGLNTGLADAFNLIWKMNMVLNFGADPKLLRTYESERKPVAISVVETSGELVRATKDSLTGNHADDYVDIVKKRAGNITGMGIRYGNKGLPGSRLFDFEVANASSKTRLYSLLNYGRFTLLIFGEFNVDFEVPKNVTVIRIHKKQVEQGYWVAASPYENQAILVRPDAYIEAVSPIDQIELIIHGAQL